MKTLVLVACLLAVVYASNPKAVKTFQDTIGKCAQELNKSPDEIDVAYCALQKQGWIDEKDQYLLEEDIAAMDDLITDEVKRNEAKEIIRKCYGPLRGSGEGVHSSSSLAAARRRCAAVRRRRAAAPSPQRHRPPSGHHVPPPGQHVPPRGQHVPPRGQHVPPRGQHVPPGRRGRRTVGEIRKK